MKLAIICRENHTKETRVRSVDEKTFKTLEVRCEAEKCAIVGPGCGCSFRSLKEVLCLASPLTDSD